MFSEIDKLPKGEILAAVIITDSFWYDKSKHSSDPWCLGPFCYRIQEIMPFERGVKHKGNVGLWNVSPKAYDAIMAQDSVKRKINQWMEKYGSEFRCHLSVSFVALQSKFISVNLFSIDYADYILVKIAMEFPRQSPFSSHLLKRFCVT